jgi:predicted ATPase
MFGLCVYYGTRAEHQTAHELAEQLLRLAEQAGDQALILQAHHALWASRFAAGDHASAHAHVEQGLALCAHRDQPRYVFRYAGHDAQVCGLAWGGPALWCMGYPDQALRRNREALALARELAHSVSIVLALKWLASLCQLRREAQAVQTWAEAAIDLASEQRLSLWLGWAGALRGWALAQQGQGKAGVAHICQGIDTYRATGAALDRPYMLALLAQAYTTVGRTEEGLRTLDEALAAAHGTGERYYEAELYRLKGELLLARDHGEAATEAEGCYRQAIEVARRQRAKSLELRAVMSQSRLWHKQGKSRQAHKELAQVYGWFTEGHDTPDLQEAKALLEALS